MTLTGQLILAGGLTVALLSAWYIIDAVMFSPQQRERRQRRKHLADLRQVLRRRW